LPGVLEEFGIRNQFSGRRGVNAARNFGSAAADFPSWQMTGDNSFRLIIGCQALGFSLLGDLDSGRADETRYRHEYDNTLAEISIWEHFFWTVYGQNFYIGILRPLIEEKGTPYLVEKGGFYSETHKESARQRTLPRLAHPLLMDRLK
jgi:hypothetical protein